MKIGCACGRMILDSTDNLPTKAHIVSDQDWDGMFDALEAVLDAVAEGRLEREAGYMKLRTAIPTRLAWQCAACGRLYVDNPDYELQAFVPAEPTTDKSVFRRRR